jgi:hypothetical protein
LPEIQLRVPLFGEDAERFERIKKNTGIQSNTDVIRYVLKKFDEVEEIVRAKK